MSLRTYSYKVKGFYQTILVKMKKDDAENVKRDLSMVADIRRYRRELTGVVDQDERQSTLYSPFSAPVDLADEAGFQQEMAQLLESLPIRITYQNWPQILQTIQDIFERHVPVYDYRETPDEHAEKLQQREEQRQQQDARRQAEAEQYQAAKEQAIQNHPHLQPLTDGDNKKTTWAAGAANIRTELKQVFPGQKFSVTSESFSMGNAINITWTDGPTRKEVEAITNKYQQGRFDGMVDSYSYNDNVFHTVFGGAKYVSADREISRATRQTVAAGLGYDLDEITNAHGQIADQDIERNINERIFNTSFYQAPAENTHQADEAAADDDGNVEIRTNPDKNGIEIRFSAKPYDGILAILRAHGYRWHRKRKFWYAQQNEKTWAAARDIAERFNIDIHGEEVTTA